MKFGIIRPYGMFLGIFFSIAVASANAGDISVTSFVNQKHPDKPEVPTVGRKAATGSAKEPKIVIIGASYVKGWPLNGFRGIQFLNRGVNGEQTSEMLVRFQGDLVSVKPEMVIIWGFINDIFRSSREEMESKLVQTRKNIEFMIGMAQEHKIQPILVTEVTIRGKDDLWESVASWAGRLLGKKSYQDYVNNKVMDTNRWIRDTAANRNLILLDFQPLLANENGMRKKEFATPDGSHISPMGYEVLTRYTEEVLTRHRIP